MFNICNGNYWTNDSNKNFKCGVKVMISLFSSWARGIVIAVVVSTIIEMILPNGSSKKYVKSVIGIYILFVIISPVAKKITGKVDVNEILSNYEKKAEIAEENFERKNENNSNRTIKDIYISNLKEDIKEKLSGKGYEIDNLVVKIKNDDSYEIEKVTLYMSNSSKKDEKIVVNMVTVGQKVNNYKLNESEQNEVKEYISQNYGVSKENIEIT